MQQQIHNAHVDVWNCTQLVATTRQATTFDKKSLEQNILHKVSLVFPANFKTQSKESDCQEVA